MARQKRTMPFRILTDDVLIELVKKTPVTAQEAINIKGVGPSKVKTVIPKFLAAIHAWRNRELNQ